MWAGYFVILLIMGVDMEEDFIKKLEKMLKTMEPDAIVATLTDEEKIELSRMITDMDLNNVIQKSLDQQSNN